MPRIKGFKSPMTELAHVVKMIAKWETLDESSIAGNVQKYEQRLRSQFAEKRNGKLEELRARKAALISQI